MVAAGDAEGWKADTVSHRCLIHIRDQRRSETEEILSRYGVSISLAKEASSPACLSESSSCFEIDRGGELIRELTSWVEGDSLNCRFADFSGHLWNEGIAAVYELIPSADIARWVELSITAGNVMSAEKHLTRLWGGLDVFPDVCLRLAFDLSLRQSRTSSGPG